MTDINALDTSLTELIEKRITLSGIDYSSKDYDRLEEELHDLEDVFLSKYSDYLDEALHEVHDEFCPDNDVLLPIAYLPKQIKRTETGYAIDISEGVFVEVDDYASKNTKLALLPKPTRIVLIVDENQQEVVWKAE